MSTTNQYARHMLGDAPQDAPLPGQNRNNAGGYSFVVDDWVRLDRWLILGASEGSYYVGERKLVRENAAAVERCLQVDGLRVVRAVTDASVSGRAPKNDPAIFALAMAMKLGNDATRQAAQEAVPKVCRTGTHLFALAEAVEVFGGWGRGTKRAFGRWYTDREPERLAYQLVKYQQRDGWSHRDVLRLSKPRGSDCDSRTNALLHWATAGWPDVGVEPHPDEALRLVWAFERAKRSESPAETVRLVEQYGLPRECVRTEHLGSPEVWDALLRSGRGMPLTALVRNLAKMTTVGLLAPLSDATRYVQTRLGDAEYLRAARVHPLAILVALRTYAQGHGERGSLRWTPVTAITDALDGAFYGAFPTVQSTGKRLLLALDVSESMDGGTVAGLPGVTPRVGAAAMALVTAATEPNHHIVGFTSSGWGGAPSMHGSHYPACISTIDISPKQRLDAVVRQVSRLPMGGTDCSLPMLYAAAHRIPVDAFLIFTDSETWAGNVHPHVALRQYRQQMGIPAKLVVVGMTSAEFTIADPSDAGMLDCCGFDTAAPEIMRDFVGQASS